MTAGSFSNPEAQANTITAIKAAIGEMADNVFKAESRTAMWTPDQALIRGFQQAKTGQLPSITLDGLGDYNKAKGYPEGSVTLSWTDYTLAYDRGRKFNLDNIDIMQERGQLESGYVLAEFMRQKVVPEIDATNISKVAQAVVAAQGSVVSSVGKNILYGYTPAASSILSTITKKIREVKAGAKLSTSQGITVHFNNAYADVLDASTEITKSRDVTNGIARVNGEIDAINGATVEYVDEDLMYSSFTYDDGVTSGENAGGFSAASGALKLVCLVTAPGCVNAINAYQATKIITGDQNQLADATSVAFRSYFDCIVPTNKRPGCALVTSTAYV